MLDRCAIGILDHSQRMGSPSVVEKYRDFTISWCRYDYRDELIEAAEVNDILDRAVTLGHRWCLILPYGHVPAERWLPEELATAMQQPWQLAKGVLACEPVAGDEFLVAGSIVANPDHWYGFENEFLLVNLDAYQRLSRPRFDLISEGPIELPGAIVQTQDNRIAALQPAERPDRRQPNRLGWNFISTSLRHGLPVFGFAASWQDKFLDLNATCPRRCEAMAGYLGTNLIDREWNAAEHGLGQGQTTFLDMVGPQVTGARNGVFLWNIESYEDIEQPADDFSSPVSSMYCVAAGFKPNRILQTHQFDQDTRVVYFDYSPQAITIKRYLLEHWDGSDFPRFTFHLFDRFPHPETFYQLWDGLTPDSVAAEDVDRMWGRELDRWGGESEFRAHWHAYRKLQHEFVICDIMQDPTPLLDLIDDSDRDIIWWSNAFFTVYGNWHHTLETRKQIYERFVDGLVSCNPQLHLLGSDYTNANVNGVRAADYWRAYALSASSWLQPFRPSKTEIRM